MDSLNTRFNREVVSNFTAMLRSQYQVHQRFQGIKDQWHSILQDPKQLINGPFLEAATCYERGASLDALPLADDTKRTITEVMGGHQLYKHQSDALTLVLGGGNVVVATGTSSGKTRCFQLPILDDLIRDPSPGLRAIIIYPMNALVNDQLQDWERLLAKLPQITFARFTGQTPSDEKAFEAGLREACRARHKGKVDPDELDDAANEEFHKEMAKARATPNHLRHRGAIRQSPPHILVTNFSMLEYLLVRPIDAPVFEGARLKFLVLDEAHAYRSVQATEIAFLLRRLKERLGVTKPVCIATSATLGKAGDAKSIERVRLFASGLFGEQFNTNGLIYGTTKTISAPPKPAEAGIADYLAAGDALAKGGAEAALAKLPATGASSLREWLESDANVFKLRSEVLRKPVRFEDASGKIFKDHLQREAALSALLALVATADENQPGHEALLPTRLHYFLRAQDGLHVCLREDCPGRHGDVPAVYSSRRSDIASIPEGSCPACHAEGIASRLVEVVSCRRCGWLYGALRDLGPTRARAKRDVGEASVEGAPTVPAPSHDSFDTDLGWAPDSFHTYVSVGPELPYPRPIADGDEDRDNEKLIFNPEQAAWCAACGKRQHNHTDSCQCGAASHLRQIDIFHRQCPSDQGTEQLEKDVKHMLGQCPNCLARNTMGVEPVRRFQESEDEAGLAAAIPFAHFDVSPWLAKERWKIRKLLCFADQRQKAATFPALLEDETFPWDLGREITRIALKEKKPLKFTKLAELLNQQFADDTLSPEDKLLLPSSVRPEGDDPDWKQFFQAQIFAYFGIPDSSRDSAEDFGAVRVRYDLDDAKRMELNNVLEGFNLSPSDSEALLQTLFGYARKRKAFGLPPGVKHNDPAFGRVTADIFLAKEKGGLKNAEGFVSAVTSAQGNEFTNYLARTLSISIAQAREVASSLWDVFTKTATLRQDDGDRWRLIPSHLQVEAAPQRFCCSACQTVATWNCRDVCPKKECSGTLVQMPSLDHDDRLIARWVSALPDVTFQSLASEEHTAQLAKNVAALVEEDFRGAGVNLLSSTTTFEMGINIGDLQKVLLRNAPPSAASYIQRVGRAGRGADRNAVCVTLCKGTKYDLDCWRQPEQRLMQGTVNPPSVFLLNAHLAQRHLNAYFFASALRASMETLGSLARKQQIPLGICIPQELRTGLPLNWFPQGTQNMVLDLQGAMSGCSLPVGEESSLHDIAAAVGGWATALTVCIESFAKRIQEVRDDLQSLLDERKERFAQGQATGDSERAIQSILKADLISILAKRGFLPRYAFPLDVVELVTKADRYAESDVDLSRDRGQAIGEYAPGAQVVARKQMFTSGGLFFSTRKEMPDPQWFWRCPECQLVRTELTKTKLKESLGDSCPACKGKVLEPTFRRFIQPTAFLHDEKAKANFGRTKPIRQRQGLTHFIDTLDDVTFTAHTGFNIALKKNGKLFRYNYAPGNKGFKLCRLCGRSEPVPLTGASATQHKWLRYLPIFGRNEKCSSEANRSITVAYGHIFESFCLVVRPLISPPSRESLGYALHRGLCEVLELDLNEVGVSFRRSQTGGDEIVLFDKAPGGAGLVLDARERWGEVVESALRIVGTCCCETACYECLKDFSNQTHHEFLNRNMTGLNGGTAAICHE
ncbi:DEAD/DEAH box helicase [Brevifollis gellanilyticus]|uniref:Helicase n=1 Tax=Brevifollis gellanilyticus TaxID=748831 RepID=A0A512MGL0_9BACT|nr:DEAD/DEAH box helicase [Brevifollis gellanilyticus]GEP45873.1 helicase [Brevifollis gellanilyticus]